MNIDYPNKNSDAYKQFLEMTTKKVSDIMSWLSDRHIDYVWNYWINNHLYRIYIPAKDLLLDFECYPVNNINYNYIRINYDTDVIDLMCQIFPETILDTDELEVWKLNQRIVNRFFRNNGSSPIYDKSVLRLALVKDTEIYQCIVIKDTKVIANVTKKNCSIPYGTYILYRYLNEVFGFSEITMKENLDNSYITMLYQLINAQRISKTAKRKIWWNPNGTKWRITKSEENQYVPFYLTEQVTYKYSK